MIGIVIGEGNPRERKSEICRAVVYGHEQPDPSPYAVYQNSRKIVVSGGSQLCVTADETPDEHRHVGSLEDRLIQREHGVKENKCRTRGHGRV